MGVGSEQQSDCGVVTQVYGVGKGVLSQANLAESWGHTVELTVELIVSACCRRRYSHKRSRHYACMHCLSVNPFHTRSSPCSPLTTLLKQPTGGRLRGEELVAVVCDEVQGLVAHTQHLRVAGVTSLTTEGTNSRQSMRGSIRHRVQVLQQQFPQLLDGLSTTMQQQHMGLCNLIQSRCDNTELKLQAMGLYLWRARRPEVGWAKLLGGWL